MMCEYIYTKYIKTEKLCGWGGVSAAFLEVIPLCLTRLNSLTHTLLLCAQQNTLCTTHTTLHYLYFNPSCSFALLASENNNTNRLSFGNTATQLYSSRHQAAWDLSDRWKQAAFLRQKNKPKQLHSHAIYAVHGRGVPGSSRRIDLPSTAVYWNCCRLRT